MSNLIIQLEKTPIAKEDYIKPSKYGSMWFAEEVSDNITEATAEERKFQISGIEFEFDEEGGLCLIIKDKKEHFLEQFKRFVNIIKDELAPLTLETFSGCKEPECDVDLALANLANSYSAIRSIYVDGSKIGEPIPLDDFIRYFSAEGDKFYIGAILHYDM